MEGREQGGERNDENGGEDRADHGSQVTTAAPRVPLYRMFAFADRTDAALMAVGAASAVANGMAQPLMTFIFGTSSTPSAPPLTRRTTCCAKSPTTILFLSEVSSHDNAVCTELRTYERVPHRLVHCIQVIINFVYLGIGAGLVSTLQVSCWTITGERQAARIRALYLKSILRQDIAFFDKDMSTGQVVERMSGDTFLIQDAIGEKVGMCIQLFSTFFGGFIIAFVRGWLLALVMLSSIPPVAVAGAIVSRMMTNLSSKMQEKYGDAGDIVEQTIGTIRTVVSFNGEKQAITTYNKFIRKAYESARREGAVSGLGVGSVMGILFCSYGLAVWYGSKLIVDRGYNGGIVINVIMAVMVGAMSLGQAAPSITAFAEGQGAAYRMFKTIERQPEIDVYDTTGIMLEDIKGDVELKDVYFSYPTRPEHLVFHGFSLRVPTGMTMALVGESGSGKSTVVSLVERFYDPQSGEVLIDGVDIRRMNLGWIRGKIGLVSQEPVLFSSTIRENIAYGKDNLTLEEIKRAIEFANAANFIDKLPNGLETMVGERGTQLSGGQKQRIAIARAIIKNPRILLLDEATSALDMESERVVQEALDRVMLERTTIIVAHRLSTVKNADVISVLQYGKIVEQGSHAELVKKPEGAYSQLIHLQDTLQDAEAPNVDPDVIMKKGLDSRSITRKPRSQSTSFRRSSSRGSSFGHSGRHPCPAPFGLSDPMEFNNGQDLEETAEKISSSRKKAPIRRLFYLNKPEAFVLALGSVTAAAHGTILPVYGILISSAIKTFYEPPAELLKDSRFWASMFVMLGASALVLIPIEYFLFGLAGGKLVERIRSLTFQRIMHQDIDWFDKPEHSSGAIGARLSTDALNVKRLVGDNLALNVQTVSTIIVGFTVAMVANWKLALIITVVVPFVGFQAYAQMKFLKGLNKNAKLKYEEASQVATDAVGGIRTVASFCAEQKFVHDGKATFPEVFRVFFVLVLATSGISRTSAIGADSTKANESAISVFEILDRKSKIDSSSEEGTVVGSVRGNIEFQNVYFYYPLRPSVQIFNDRSLSIPSGQTAALVGESGSGKSAAIALLERFYDPNSGKILLDGEASEEEIVAAAEASNAHQFISGLPDGYDTVVGERGIQLSGGQKQRVAIARAIVKDPKVLLLDEATSALDAESERVVQEALDRVMVGRTTVVVAHRLSTVKGADIISVVKNGTIVEKGRHEELMRIKDGAYASLVELSST
ncbi:unnamed protein product [Alopecurus aequalis]